MKVSSTSILSLVLALNGAMASALQARGYEVVTVTELATEYVHVTSTAWVEPAQDAPTPISTTAPDSHEKNKNKNHVTTDTPSTTLSILSVSESSTTTISTPSTPPAPAPTTKSIPADTKPPTTLQTSTLPPTTPVSTPAPKAEPSTTAPAPVPSAPAVGTPNVGSSGGSGENHVGDATFYAPGLGSCGITSTESQYVAALAAPLMDSQKTANSNNNPFCGKTILVSYNGGPQIPVTVVDRCPECKTYDLDLSPAAFEACGAKKDQGRVKMTWCFA